MKLFITITLVCLLHNNITAQNFKNETEAKKFLKNHKISDSIEGIWSLTSSMEVYENDILVKTVASNEHTKRIVIFIIGDSLVCLNTDGTYFGSLFEKTALKNQYIYTDFYTDEQVSATLFFDQNTMTTSYFLPKGIQRDFLGDEAEQKKLKHNLKFIKTFPTY